jgi:hypothetical protein
MPALAPTYPGGPWYSVSMTITADWPLEGKSIEALVAEVEKLQAKIAAADVPGERPVVSSAAGSGEATPEATPRTAPARPVVAATPATAYPATTPGYAPASYASTCQPAPYMPPTSARFICVARLSNPQRKAAMAEAFGKAKAEADELAEAAGGKLGQVATLKHYVISGVPDEYRPGAGGYTVVMSQPAEAEFCIKVQAQFRLE